MITMADALSNPYEEVFAIWGEAIEQVVGEGNYSMEPSGTVAKQTYAQLLPLGNTTYRQDLEGDEIATTLTFQTDSYASGRKALTKVLSIDAAGHRAMVKMGFARTYGPKLMANADESIKRVTSRYSKKHTEIFDI